MNWLMFLLAALGLTAAILYWLLVTTEGVFLGRRVVVWLYDRTADRYDAIKEFDLAEDQFFIGRPMFDALAGQQQPRVLDVATGTGRLPLLLLDEAAFRGWVVGLEPSAGMLAQATGKTAGCCGQLNLVQGTAAPLPFPDETFDAVSCLEALEFLPSDTAALREMVRVLRPGGFLMTTRRCGWQARAFLGRYRAADQFETLLRELGLANVQSHLWQVDYDLVTGTKPA